MAKTSRFQPLAGISADQIGLVQHDEVGSHELVFVDFGERVVVIDRGILFALAGDRLRIVGKAPFGDSSASATAMTPSTVRRERMEGQSKALTSGFGKASPEVSIRMCSGGRHLGRSAPAWSG